MGPHRDFQHTRTTCRRERRHLRRNRSSGGFPVSSRIARRSSPVSRHSSLCRRNEITSEFVPSKVCRARENLSDGGLDDLVEIREGDALQTLKNDLPDQVDLLLLGGTKALYPQILSRVENRLRAGALVVADNADRRPDYLAQMRSKYVEDETLEFVGGPSFDELHSETTRGRARPALAAKQGGYTLAFLPWLKLYQGRARLSLPIATTAHWTSRASRAAGGSGSR